MAQAPDGSGACHTQVGPVQAQAQALLWLLGFTTDHVQRQSGGCLGRGGGGGGAAAVFHWALHAGSAGGCTNPQQA